jgi:predicted GNAT family acetyltransferase
MAQRIFQLTRVRPPAEVPGRLRRGEARDRARIGEWVAAFTREAMGPHTPVDAPDAVAERWLSSPARGLYFWEVEGQVVSMAGTSGPTPNGLRIGAVYTPPEQRRRGYASALVAALSQRILDGGRRFAFLFTDAANPTSNHIYQAIGYEYVCDADEYYFDPPEGGQP